MSNSNTPQKGEKSKISKSFDKLKKNENVESFFSYAKNNTRDVIAYVLLILGIIFLFFDHNYGGFLIGAVFGLYFGDETIAFLRTYKENIGTQNTVKSLVFGALLLGLLISAPGIFIGALVVISLRFILFPEKDRS